MRALLLLLLVAPGAHAQTASGFVESGGRLVHFEVVRDSTVVFGQGVEGRPRVTIPYAAFVDALGRAAEAGALVPDTLAGPNSIPFALDVDDRSVVRLATAVPVGTLALGLLGAGLIALVGGAVVWERRARKARRLRAEFRRRLAAAREAERAHVARELHDGPVQDLCAIQVALGGQGSETAREAVNGVVGELRALCDELRPSALDAFGLTAALAALADRAGWGEGGAPDVRFRMDPAVRPVADGPALSDEKRLAIYRIAQEALNNAVQHAGADRIDLTLAFEGTTLTLAVDDDGVGPPEADALDLAAEGHYGLLGMQERADLLRADLAISRGPLGGTRIALALPIPAHRLDAIHA